MNAGQTSAAFAPTRWTLVVRARGGTPEARVALSELCDAYYRPVLMFLRREGRVEDAARELAQDFFAGVLRGGDLGAAEPGKGRFRSYLLGALRHFLADRRKHELRQKRGGGVILESLDAPQAGDTPPLDIADGTAFAPDEWFDREWALAIMERSLQAVENEYKQAGNADQFESLKPWLAGEKTSLSQAAVASRLGLTEGALKVAVHRLRKRFRERIRSEISQTMANGGDIDDELRYLIGVLSRNP